MMSPRKMLLAILVLLGSGFIFAFTIAGCGSGQAPAAPTESDATPPADSIGEALFLDTRFGQFFAANSTGVNTPLATGDPIVAEVQTPNGPLPGPFAGQAMNCRSCHFVTEFQGVSGAGNRTYADFTTRSPIPRPQPNGFRPHSAQCDADCRFLHQPLRPHLSALRWRVCYWRRPGDRHARLGRNSAGFRRSTTEAVAHIAQVIRQDDGSSQLAADRLNGLSYAVLFKGTDPRIPGNLLLPPSQRMDVSTATDAQVVNEVALCITTYMQDLLFQTRCVQALHRLAVRQFSASESSSRCAVGRPIESRIQPGALSAGAGVEESHLHHACGWDLQISRAAIPVWSARIAGAENLSGIRGCRRDQRARRELRRLPPGARLL